MASMWWYWIGSWTHDLSVCIDTGWNYNIRNHQKINWTWDFQFVMCSWRKVCGQIKCNIMTPFPQAHTSSPWEIWTAKRIEVHFHILTYQLRAIWVLTYYIYICHMNGMSKISLIFETWYIFPWKIFQHLKKLLSPSTSCYHFKE